MRTLLFFLPPSHSSINLNRCPVSPEREKRDGKRKVFLNAGFFMQMNVCERARESQTLAAREPLLAGLVPPSLSLVVLLVVLLPLLKMFTHPFSQVCGKNVSLTMFNSRLQAKDISETKP
jgi:hypothetical protein